MKRNIGRFALVLFVWVIIFIGFWLGGFEFKRGYDLGFAFFLACALSGIVLIIEHCYNLKCTSKD